jgi:hypothetical protein
MSTFNDGAALKGLDFIKVLVCFIRDYSIVKHRRLTTLQSQRDLSNQIPINFVPVAGVSLTAACFPFGRYAASAGAKCFSNLLESGFRRLDLDLYWDVSRSVWSFCPVELGEASPGMSTTQDGPESPTSASTVSLTTGQLTQREIFAYATPSSALAVDLERRQNELAQTSSTYSASSSSTFVATSSVLSTVASTVTFSADATTTSTNGAGSSASSQIINGETLIQIGPYACSSALDFRVFLTSLNGNLGDTEDSLNATMKYIILNLHVARSVDKPLGPAATPSVSDLPRNRNLLSNLIGYNNSQYLFTPEFLDAERANLNVSTSWFGGARQYYPDPAYMQLNNMITHSSTPDGWPSESFVQLANARRVLAGFGVVDSQLEAYEFSADAASIFPQGYLQDPARVAFGQDGELSSGCFFDKGVTTLANINSSWATAEVGDLASVSVSSIDTSLAQASNLTACGITPILNTTLLNTTADVDFTPYQAYIVSTIWGWGVDQPRTAPGNFDDEDGTANRCAVLNATSARWQTADCANSYHVACRVGQAPYVWSVSGSSVSYQKAGDVCYADTSFAVPRTGLENTYLAAAFRTYLSTNTGDDDSDNSELLWLDFNDLDASTCWVVGQNSTCPYRAQNETAGKAIVVPTVAAVIVFVIALLVIIVKCASNRRNTKRKSRRGDDGWDYEGVPS